MYSFDSSFVSTRHDGCGRWLWRLVRRFPQETVDASLNVFYSHRCRFALTWFLPLEYATIHRNQLRVRGHPGVGDRIEEYKILALLHVRKIDHWHTNPTIISIDEKRSRDLSLECLHYMEACLLK